MKTLFTLAISFLTLISSVYGITYTSMADGAINNPAIWSTDGGVTPCSCIPVADFGSLMAINKGNIEINHHITSPVRTSLLGTSLTVNINASGSFIVSGPFEVRAGVVRNFAVLNAHSVTVYNSGFLYSFGVMNIDPGDLVNNFQGRIEIYGQVYINSGNVYNNGFFTMRSSSQVIAAGNLTNDAYFLMEPGSCVNLYGQVQNNREMNLINGPGNAYVQSGSNITNDSLWNSAIDYCAPGTVSGLSHAQNCAGCGTLPVELVDFNASIDQDQTVLNWETKSETQNSFFTIERSADGENFETVIDVLSDSPLQGASYQAVDPAPYSGISWYRLSQTDQNGTTRTLETVMVQSGLVNSNHFNAFPNPFNETIRVTTLGMEGASVEIRVLDVTGKIVATQIVDNTFDHQIYEVNPGSLQPGLYLVQVTGKQKTESFKLFHK